jgi:rubrerythrin
LKTIKGSQTEKNLLKAFAGESQARNRYTMFAAQAEKEGYIQIANLFAETADNERIHAERFFSFLEGGPVEITAIYPAGKVGSTYENLMAAAGGENEEYTEIYPTFARIAKEEGFGDVAAAFLMIAKVEKEHEQRYLKLADNVEKEKVFKKDEAVRWKCEKCGYVHEGPEPPAKCPACLRPKEFFELKETNY